MPSSNAGVKEEEPFLKTKASITTKSTMAFFKPARSIIVRVEASYHEGLSTGLFQEMEKALQPAHFISRTMTEVEVKYSQTERCVGSTLDQE